jgi:hypothetical protein
MAGQCSCRFPDHSLTVIPSMPGLPLLAFPHPNACLHTKRIGPEPRGSGPIMALNPVLLPFFRGFGFRFLFLLLHGETPFKRSSLWTAVHRSFRS